MVTETPSPAVTSDKPQQPGCVAGGFIGMLFGAILFALAQAFVGPGPELYESKVTIMLSGGTDFAAPVETARTDVELLTSDKLLQPATDALEPVDDGSRLDIETLRTRLTIRREDNQPYINLRLRGESPSAVRDVLEAIANAYCKHVERRSSDHFNNQKSKLTQRITDHERSLQRLEVNHQLVTKSLEDSDASDTRLANLHAASLETELQLKLFNAAVDATTKQIESIDSDPAKQSILKQLLQTDDAIAVPDALKLVSAKQTSLNARFEAVQSLLQAEQARHDLARTDKIRLQNLDREISRRRLSHQTSVAELKEIALTEQFSGLTAKVIKQPRPGVLVP